MKNRFLAMITVLIMLLACLTAVSAIAGSELGVTDIRILESIPGKAATVTEVVISGATTVKVGKTTKLKATVKPSNASQKVTWKSSNEKIATVSAKGVVKGIKKGKVTITATSKANPKIKAKWKMKVEEAEVKPTKVTITGAKYVTIGGTTTLTSSVKPANASQTVTWESSDTTIATVSAKGVVKGIKQGKVSITAASKVNPKVKATWKMTVTEAVSSVDITGSKFVAVGYTVKLKASVQPENAPQTVLWKSSNPNIASVSKKGVVTGNKPGKVKITAISAVDPGKKKVWNMTVKNSAVSQITLSPDPVLLFLDGTKTARIQADVYPEDAAESFTWKSKDTRIATVTEKGIVTGIAVGKTTIIVTATDGSGTEAEVNVFVQEFGPEEFASDFTYQSYDYDARTVYITGYKGDKTEITIPKLSPEGERVVGIGSYCFQENTKITGITTQETLEWIDYSAFSGCSHLTSLKLANGLTQIRTYAFNACIHLKQVTIPGTVNAIEAYAFSGCKEMNSLTIESGVTEIQTAAFSECNALTSVQIPSTVVTIDGSFIDCASLATVTLEPGVTNLNNAFSGCKSLVSIAIPATVTEMDSICNGCKSLQEANIAEGVKKISNYAFSDCISLKTIEIPASVTTIGFSAFQGCTSLSEAIILKGVTAIEGNAFASCTNLSHVEIPSSVITIGYYAFSDCTNLNEINIPNSVVTIENCAFWACKNLREIHIPSSVITIEGSAFYNTGLRRVIIDEGLIELQSGAFSGCELLSYVKLPGSLVTIADGAIEKTDRLTTIHCPTGSVAWRYALDHDMLPIDGNAEPDPGYSDPDDEIEFTGNFTLDSKTLYLGDTWIVEGTVTVSQGYLGRVTVNSPDLAGSSMTDDFIDHNFTSVNLKEWGAYTIDTSSGPWNQPGTYTLRLWAKDTNGIGGTAPLDTMTLEIKEKPEPVVIHPSSDLATKFSLLESKLPTGSAWIWAGDPVAISYGSETITTHVAAKGSEALINHTHSNYSGCQAFGWNSTANTSECRAGTTSWGGIQCHGYAVMVAWAISGKNFYHVNTGSFKLTANENNRDEIVNNLAPGDIVRCYSSSGHTFVVTDTDEDNIYLTDCNYKDNWQGTDHPRRYCVIQWGYKEARSKFMNNGSRYLLYVYKYHGGNGYSGYGD